MDESEKGAGEKEARLGGNQVQRVVDQDAVSKEQNQRCREGSRRSQTVVFADALLRQEGLSDPCK